jgi:NAD(P)-dependent dehydrogenase (short-subunit alcohol dehydrogenase family)
LESLAQEFITDVGNQVHNQNGWPTSAYSVSKIALNALVRIWADSFTEKGLHLNSVCPGWARTDMGGNGAPRSAEQGAASIIWAALPGCKSNGGFFRDGKKLAW